MAELSSYGRKIPEGLSRAAKEAKRSLCAKNESMPVLRKPSIFLVGDISHSHSVIPAQSPKAHAVESGRK